MSEDTTETKEEFVRRYPRPSNRRVLVRCFCMSSSTCTGWAWGRKDDVQPNEELAE